MARPRSDLQQRLKLITPHVYFQPPENIKMEYPCIVYERSDINVKYADNSPYSSTNRYTVTVIDRNPESAISSAIALLPLCSFDRFFAADNLNHDVYTLYF